MYNEFWKRTNELIKSQNKTQTGLSIECGFTERRVNNLSANNRSPDVIEAVRMAQALGTTVEYLVTGQESNKAAEELAELKARLADVLK